jgi:hypothetical protein
MNYMVLIVYLKKIEKYIKKFQFVKFYKQEEILEFNANSLIANHTEIFIVDRALKAWKYLINT